jgi:hypothetical protein
MCFVFCILFLNSNGLCGTASDFETVFGDGTLRVDLIHSGTSIDEEYAIRSVIKQSNWAGPTVNLVPTGDMGKYRVDLYDKTTGNLIYRHGFSSLFGEWQTTGEASTTRRAFEETLEFPYPKKSIDLEISSRNKKGEMVRVFSAAIDPNSHLIGRPVTNPGVKVHEILLSGESSEKLDLLILGDGYTLTERVKFKNDCEHIADRFLGTAPFDSLRDKINVRAIMIPSAESGIDEPRKGIFRDTPFGMSFNTFDSPRYCMTEAIWAIHDAAAAAPHDAILVMGNSSRYGGGAIFNFYTAFISDNEFDDYLCVHEFGHGFSGLGDEYYSSQVSFNEFYPRGVEPWEPNITALLDPEHVKWAHFVDKDTPIPTPADNPNYGDKTGAFEGAGYAAKGLYRPAVDCKMFSKGQQEFCAVCRQAVVDMILFYAPKSPE